MATMRAEATPPHRSCVVRRNEGEKKAAATASIHRASAPVMHICCMYVCMYVYMNYIVGGIDMMILSLISLLSRLSCARRSVYGRCSSLLMPLGNGHFLIGNVLASAPYANHTRIHRALFWLHTRARRRPRSVHRMPLECVCFYITLERVKCVHTIKCLHVRQNLSLTVSPLILESPAQSGIKGRVLIYSCRTQTEAGQSRVGWAGLGLLWRLVQNEKLNALQKLWAAGWVGGGEVRWKWIECVYGMLSINPIISVWKCIYIKYIYKLYIYLSIHAVNGYWKGLLITT